MRKYFNALMLRQNGRHSTDDIFKGIFLKENIWIPIKISLKFVPRGLINNNLALVQIMAWPHPGDNPLSEPMMVYRRIYASMGLNELSAVYTCIWDLKLVITVLADDLAPTGAGSSAGPVPTTKVDMFSLFSKFLRPLMISDIID